jgi:hypothetical protein
VPGDDLAVDADTGLDVPELVVAVRGLVEFMRSMSMLGQSSDTLYWGVQIQQGPVQGAEPDDPHLGR